MKVLALFDLDGTITQKDTLLDFIKFTRGKFEFYLGILVLSPVLILFKLKIIPNWRSKEILLNWYFRKWSKDDLCRVGKKYSLDRLPELILPSALDRIKKHKEEHDRVIIVSASCDVWLKAWCQLHDLELISTELEFEDNIFTGRFCTLNCHGTEKVNRINKLLVTKDYDLIHAYGNEKSDLPMLDLAHKKYYRQFS